MPFNSPNFSWIVKRSANICVGWYSLVSPFQTGTPAYSASSSTIFCPNPRYSIPSNILPNTLAVSAMLSFLPICEPCGSRYVTPIPRSWAATSNEQRVLVLVFSKISAIFFPSWIRWLIPFFFFSFNSFDNCKKYPISSGVKSFNVKKLRPFKSMINLFSAVHSVCCF